MQHALHKNWALVGRYYYKSMLIQMNPKKFTLYFSDYKLSIIL